jgi:CheY-like chemotaxis protein
MTAVGLTEDMLFRLHPTAIRIDPTLTIKSFGPVASAYSPAMRRGQRLPEFFDLVPDLERGGLAALTITQEALVLVSKERGIRLSGQVIAADSDYLIVSKPVITPTTNPLQALQISDFPADDPLVQCLLQIALLQGLRDEAEQNAHDLRLAWEENVDLLGQIRHFSGVVAHEFSNLLSIIQLNCERLASPDGITTDTARTISLIRETAQRGGSVSHWLRALSGDSDLAHREPLDDCLKANLALLKALSGPNVVVTARLMASGANLDAPMSELLSCLVNLIRMVAASGENSIQTDIATRIAEAPDSALPMAEVSIRLEASKPIDGADLLSRGHHMFLGHQSGRASVSDFIDSVGGTAQYQSDGENAGVITFHIPCVPETGRRQGTVLSTNESVAGSDLHLIVVEDEPAALEALVELLEFEGFSVNAFGNAEEALAGLSERPESILVTDVVLPDMDGLALAKAATLLNPQRKVVIMSGHIPDRAQSDPRWVFLQKPFDVDDLVTAITQAEQ